MQHVLRNALRQSRHAARRIRSPWYSNARCREQASVDDFTDTDRDAAQGEQPSGCLHSLSAIDRSSQTDVDVDALGSLLASSRPAGPARAEYDPLASSRGLEKPNTTNTVGKSPSGSQSLTIPWILSSPRGPAVPNAEKVKKSGVTPPPDSAINAPSTPELDKARVERNTSGSLEGVPTQNSHVRFIDHRRPSALWDFNSSASPGSAFFLPPGQRVLDAFQGQMKRIFRATGVQMITSPVIYRKQLYRSSGHWDAFEQNMYKLENLTPDNETVTEALKPMNCPGHCAVYNREWRREGDLPLRLGEFSPVFRREGTGVLHGLKRTKMFHQDDVHHFCTEHHIHHEVVAVIKQIQYVYQHLLGIPHYEVCLSTRPEKGIGDDASWDTAEKILCDALRQCGFSQWKVSPGEGAFYGPKIDFMVPCFTGMAQMGTIQLDLQLPRRLGLTYISKDLKKCVPLLLHRAILGSFERALAVCFETNHEYWPFWCSPNPVIILPVVQQHTESRCVLACQSIAQELREHDIDATIDCRRETLSRRVAKAGASRYNIRLFVGEKDLQNDTVTMVPRRIIPDDIPLRQSLLHGERDFLRAHPDVAWNAQQQLVVKRDRAVQLLLDLRNSQTRIPTDIRPPVGA